MYFYDRQMKYEKMHKSKGVFSHFFKTDLSAVEFFFPKSGGSNDRILSGGWHTFFLTPKHDTVRTRKARLTMMYLDLCNGMFGEDEILRRRDISRVIANSQT